MTVRRPWRTAAAFRPVTLFVDGIAAPPLENGGAVSVFLPPGQHTLILRMGRTQSPPKVVTAPGAMAETAVAMRSGWSLRGIAEAMRGRPIGGLALLDSDSEEGRRLLDHSDVPPLTAFLTDPDMGHHAAVTTAVVGLAAWTMNPETRARPMLAAFYLLGAVVVAGVTIAVGLGPSGDDGGPISAPELDWTDYTAFAAGAVMALAAVIGPLLS